ncbi:BrxA family protein [Shewanella algae]|uniref:BrxA family protein n=1 Tax=Shewanella algae TaxID=38313 RepID=UPI001C57F9A0|nr:BrxA family protein [Shewanella algae]
MHKNRSVSIFYTTQLQAGLGLVDETKLLLRLYEPHMSTSSLYEKALVSGLFPNVSARRLRNIVVECFAPRITKQQVALWLKTLEAHLSAGAFSQLLLIHTAIANRILLDFIVEVYWPKYAGGYDTIVIDDARDFVRNAVREGRTQKSWSDSTIQRVSSYVVGCCADYGLLSSGRVSKRTIQPVRLQQSAALYLSHWLHFSGLGDNAVINHECWKLFGLEPLDVREELKKLAKNGWLIVQSAGDVTRISWQLKTMEDVIDVITQG